MALPATDSFGGTDGQTLYAYSGNWTGQGGGGGGVTNELNINTGAVYPNRDNWGVGAFWNADSFNNDHYSQVVIAAIISGIYVGPSVRNASGGNAYTVSVDSADAVYLDKYVAGNYTGITSAAFTAAVNEVWRAEAEGTTIRIKEDGVTRITQTDSSLASGAAGIYGWNDGTTSRMDTWEGGNLGAAPAAVQPNARKTLLGVGI